VQYRTLWWYTTSKEKRPARHGLFWQNIGLFISNMLALLLCAKQDPVMIYYVNRKETYEARSLFQKQRRQKRVLICLFSWATRRLSACRKGPIFVMSQCVHYASVFVPYCDTCHNMGWLRLGGSLKSQIAYVECSLFHRALLQKRPIILRSLLIVATP